jgi:hypothetical protein
MDDAKIDLIAREVLASLKKAHEQKPQPSPSPASTRREPAPVSSDVSLQLLSVQGGVLGSPCIIEPDKACIGSLKCRSFGH